MVYIVYLTEGKYEEVVFQTITLRAKPLSTFNDSTKYKGIWHAGNNADFTKVLEEHIKRAKGRDSALVKYFYPNRQPADQK